MRSDAKDTVLGIFNMESDFGSTGQAEAMHAEVPRDGQSTHAPHCVALTVTSAVATTVNILENLERDDILSAEAPTRLGWSCQEDTLELLNALLHRHDGAASLNLCHPCDANV